MTSIKDALSEFDFSRKAEDVMLTFLDTIKNDTVAPHIQGTTVFEAGASSLVIYYLRKVLKEEALGRNVESSSKYFLFNLMWFIREVALAAKSIEHKHSSLQTNILFVCNVSRQHESIAPVIRELLKSEKLKIGIVSKAALPKDAQVLHQNAYYSDWTTLRDVTYIKRLIKETRQLMSYWKRKARLQLNGRIWSGFEAWFRKKAVHCVRSLLLADIMLSQTKPSIIVTTDPADFEAKSFALIGRSFGIPSLCLQYGSVCAADSEWRFLAHDYVAAFDTQSAEIIEKHGISKDKIFVTGNPRFDQYKQDDEEGRKKIRQELGLSDQTPLVVFLSIPLAPEGIGSLESYITHTEYLNVLQAVYEVPKKIQDIKLFVRFHPEEDHSVHQSFLNQNKQILIDQKKTLREILNAADVVITLHSTAGLETILLEKPLIFINLTNREDLVDYATLEAAMAVRKKEKLIPTIRLLLEDQNIRTELKNKQVLYCRHAGLVQNVSSSVRLAKLIKEVYEY